MGVVQDLFARLLQTELQRSCLPVSVLEEVAGQVQDEDDEAGEVRGVGWSCVGGGMFDGGVQVFIVRCWGVWDRILCGGQVNILLTCYLHVLTSH